jgi:hypothetical protein
MKKLLAALDQQFQQIHCRSAEFIKLVPTEKLYWQPRPKEALFPVNSCGEFILRSAAAVEQTFGGITRRLWDDPFEWTLPETLADGDLILDYLEEVEATRQDGFAFFASDEDLQRELPAPEKLKSIFQILLEAIARAEHYQGRAFAVFQTFSDKKTPRL